MRDTQEMGEIIGITKRVYEATQGDEPKALEMLANLKSTGKLGDCDVRDIGTAIACMEENPPRSRFYDLYNPASNIALALLGSLPKDHPAHKSGIEEVLAHNAIHC